MSTAAVPLVRCKNYTATGCLGSAADAPDRGPYARLCPACRKLKGQELSERGRAAIRPKTYEPHNMDAALKDLGAAAKRLEKAVARDTAARKERQLAIGEFNVAIRAVNAQAHRFLNAPIMKSSRVEERMERELQEIAENGDEPS